MGYGLPIKFRLSRLLSMLCRSEINVNNILGRLSDNILLFLPCKYGEIEKKSYFCPLFCSYLIEIIRKTAKL